MIDMNKTERNVLMSAVIGSQICLPSSQWRSHVWYIHCLTHPKMSSSFARCLHRWIILITYMLWYKIVQHWWIILIWSIHLMTGTGRNSCTDNWSSPQKKAYNIVCFQKRFLWCEFDIKWNNSFFFYVHIMLLDIFWNFYI